VSRSRTTGSRFRCRRHGLGRNAYRQAKRAGQKPARGNAAAQTRQPMHAENPPTQTSVDPRNAADRAHRGRAARDSPSAKHHNRSTTIGASEQNRTQAHRCRLSPPPRERSPRSPLWPCRSRDAQAMDSTPESNPTSSHQNARSDRDYTLGHVIESLGHGEPHSRRPRRMSRSTSSAVRVFPRGVHRRAAFGFRHFRVPSDPLPGTLTGHGPLVVGPHRVCPHGASAHEGALRWRVGGLRPTRPALIHVPPGPVSGPRAARDPRTEPVRAVPAPGGARRGPREAPAHRRRAVEGAGRLW
jgi:hypothetical protein